MAIDFTYNQGEMEAIINSLTNAKEEMTGKMESIKSELREKLIRAVGGEQNSQVAEALLETFQKEVIDPSENYLETATNFILQNQKVDDLMQDTLQANVNAATR